VGKRSLIELVNTPKYIIQGKFCILRNDGTEIIKSNDSIKVYKNKKAYT